MHPIRILTLWTLTVAMCASYPLAANSQQLIPVLRLSPPPSSTLSTWNTYLRVQESGGCSYVSLEQMAAVVEGHLDWKPVSRQVDLRVQGRRVRFFAGSSRVMVNGRLRRMEQPPMKDSDGFWIPVSFFASPDFFHAARARLQWPPVPPTPAKPVVRTAGSGAENTKTPAIPVSPQETAKPSPMTTAPRPAGAPKSIRRIVIDPGHGGKDPGTVGARGTEEKTINLLISQTLADALRERDYEVLLTRTDDTFIPLEHRSALANRYNADLFLSIHCNASLSPKLKGLEVYFLSETASDPHADAVARAENAPLALEGKAVPSQAQLQSLLHSLVRNVNINEASALGTLIDREASRASGEKSLGVKQAAFYVLRGAEMPAVLIESGFLTNRSEEKDLLNEKFRRKLVDGIVAALATYDARKAREHGHEEGPVR